MLAVTGASTTELCYSAALEDHQLKTRTAGARLVSPLSKNKWMFALVVSRSKKSGRGFAPAPFSRVDLDVPKIQETSVGGSGGDHDINGKGGNGGGDGGGSGGGGGGGGGGEEDREGKGSSEFGSLLTAEEVDKQLKARGAVLPPDMAEAARTVGIPELLLSRYLDLQASPWPLGPAIKYSPLLRNRMLADPSFLFKVFTEVAIDSGCATFAEVNKRGKDFWNEFELYASDLLVGIVMDVALVTMLAPFVQFGGSSSVGQSRLSRTLKALPSSILEAERPGRRFTVQQRLGTFFFKAIQYGAVGFICGLVGQGFASSIMVLKRRMSKSVHDEVPVPPLFKSALLWAVFMGVSSNTRYQVINGLERLVENSPIGRSVPLVALAFTVGVRFANNIYGGMQFVDWARASGVQ